MTGPDDFLFPDIKAAQPPGRSLNPGTELPLVRVAVERSLDEGYTFGKGDAEGLTYLGEGFCLGQRVEVPLGRGNTKAFGVVVAEGGRELLD
ncbi:MAG: hypothetical protein AAF235_12160, partial [Planctomycetota bacterium]